MRSHEATRDFPAVIKAAKAGKSVILADHGVTFARIEPMREASELEEEVIRELIEAGLLQPVRKSGSIREWKWKTSRSKAA